MWIEKFTVRNKWSHRGSDEKKMYLCDFHYHSGKDERDRGRLMMLETTSYYVDLTTMRRVGQNPDILNASSGSRREERRVN